MSFEELEQFRYEFQKCMVLAGIEFVNNTIQSVRTLKNPEKAVYSLLQLVKSWSTQTKMTQLQKITSLKAVVLLEKKYEVAYSLNFQKSFDFFPDGTEIDIPNLSEFFWIFLTKLDINTNQQHMKKNLKQTFADCFILYSLKNVTFPKTTSDNTTNKSSSVTPNVNPSPPNEENKDELKISVNDKKP